jgi:CheY-like chemotaxis protein
MNNTNTSPAATNILIAEDDKFLVKLYKENLEHEIEDCNISFATDGQIAIDPLGHTQPDLLILDILMPNKDGFEVLEHIRNKGYSFPIIVLTNVSHAIDQKRCTELGVSDFYIKSNTDLEKLVELCHKHISSNKTPYAS